MREDSAQEFSKADLNDLAQNAFDIALEEFWPLILVAHSSPAHCPPVVCLLCTHRAPIAPPACRRFVAGDTRFAPLIHCRPLTSLAHHRPSHTLLARRCPSHASLPRIGPILPSLSGNGFSGSLKHCRAPAMKSGENDEGRCTGGATMC